MRGIQKETNGGLGTETSTCMSEVLALAVEALVPLRHKVANGCLVKCPGPRCESVPHILLDVVVRGESFASQNILGDQKWRVKIHYNQINSISNKYTNKNNDLINLGERGLDYMEGDRGPPI